MLLSGRGEEEAQRAEQALQASGADWTIVRCSWFCQNFDDDVAGLLRYLFGEVLDGRNAYLAAGVQQALGRAPRDSPTSPATPPRPGGLV